MALAIKLTRPSPFWCGRSGDKALSAIEKVARKCIFKLLFLGLRNAANRFDHRIVGHAVIECDSKKRRGDLGLEGVVGLSSVEAAVGPQLLRFAFKLVEFNILKAFVGLSLSRFCHIKRFFITTERTTPV